MFANVQIFVRHDTALCCTIANDNEFTYAMYDTVSKVFESMVQQSK